MAPDQYDAQMHSAPPETFVEQVKQVLEHLYDFPYLEGHPLAAESVEPARAERPAETPGQRLRRQAMAAIEALSPGPGISVRAPHARIYNLLHLHYVEGLTIHEVARELSISLRQAYRDLRHGEESAAAVLWSRRATPALSGPVAGAAQASSVQTEIARLETHPRPVDLQRLLQYAQKAVERLAAQRAVDLRIEAPPEPMIVAADQAVAQQVLVNILSYAVQQAQAGILKVGLTSQKEQICLALHYVRDPKATGVLVINDVVMQLVARLGWVVQQEDQPAGTRLVALRMPVHGSTVLVIDDNEGLVELLERYLAGYACRLVAASSGPVGLELAQELAPDAIVLDVMMPGMDGWELLQIMRTRPQTAAIPVIICSVFNDPELAYSLGASLFLPKPVSRDGILAALHQLDLV
jgi:CheY-like chemotaxis protein